MNKKLLIVILVLAVSAISFTRSFLGLVGAIPWHYGYSDVYNEDRLNAGLAEKIPYLEQPVEYPVITGFFIYSMWVVGRSLLGYAMLTGIFLAIFTIITAVTLYKLAELFGIHKSRLYWCFIFAPSLLFFEIYNWDIIAVMFMALAIYFFCKNRFVWSSVLLGLGFNAKWFPIVLLPIMLLKTSIKDGIKITLIFFLTFFILNVYFIANSFDVWKLTYSYHSSREPNIDSVWSLSGLDTSAINILSMALFLIAYAILIMHHKKHGVITLSFASLMLFLLFNKIFSPQYILWLLPFIVLFQSVKRSVFYSLEAANLAVFFSTSYWILASKEQIFLIVSRVSVMARSLILTYFIYTLFTMPNPEVEIPAKAKQI